MIRTAHAVPDLLQKKTCAKSELLRSSLEAFLLEGLRSSVETVFGSSRLLLASMLTSYSYASIPFYHGVVFLEKTLAQVSDLFACARLAYAQTI